ncbi:amino acid transporter [Aspergillus neoniger CBS 115656]|uniref:Amino acid transporter n=1 Tax=Aspergillus neoniger (strain CBS 115656) TaxID=1448310 RepID=A0A318Y5I0_ASPNB|nr:amino acid transporter [Aspergillus neoniger CBS 115656]PYH29104.1 amino acid transporter [Aspergillus neoniger CBS 115656]
MKDHIPQHDLEVCPDSQGDAKGLGQTFDLDEAILRAQGREVELTRSFSWVGALGLAFSIVNSWLTYASCFGVAYSYGGGQIATFSPLLSALTQLVMLQGVAELASAFPSSGGQYHYTYIIAPKRFKNFAAYVVGMINVIAWWINTASGTIYTAISAFGICRFLIPGFVGAQWQVYLCYLLVILLTLLPIFIIPQHRVDAMTQSSMFLSILGFFLVMIVCLVMGKGTYRPSSLVEYQPRSGWAPGPAWLLGIGNGEYAFVAAGACVHISEEIPKPSRRIPLVMSVLPILPARNLTILIGVLTLMPWIIAMTCVIQDIDSVQNSFLPSLELFYQATNSKAAAAVLQAYLTILYYTCVPSQWITSSRMTWAFSRDNGLPFSTHWSKVDSKRGIPVRATLLSAGFCAVYGLLYIASTQAFNSIINTAILMLNITYTVPQGILASCGRDRLPARHYNLGRVPGYAVNFFSVGWLVVSGVFFCFPTMRTPTIADMNYNSIVICGIFAFILLCWLERRTKFSGPTINWESLNAAQAVDG